MTFTRLICLCAIIAVIHSTVAAQPAASPVSDLRIPKVTRAPALEDFLEMRPGPEVEGDLAKAGNFIQQRPRDGEPASQGTDAYLCYDDKHLYIIFVAFDSEPEKIRARMEKRENAFDDDSVEVTLDTYHDRRRGYMFWSNPLGVQAEGIWTEAQGRPDWSFDTIWHTRGQRTKEGYVVWMAIPFKSLRFPAGAEQNWTITLLRMIPRNNEWSYWPRVSSRVEGRLSQAGEVNGVSQISPGRNILLIPYGTFRSFRALDQSDPNNPRFAGDREFDSGLDAKFVLKDNFVLDVTLNPDFAQVESDQPQITANQRFEVLFPERRPFFLENSDFFQTPINLVFTRRIADPQFGVRLTGKAGPYAVGAMLIDDQAPGRGRLTGDPLKGHRALFAIARARRDLFKQSSVGAIFTDHEFQNSYNRVGGVDGRFRLTQNWVSLFQAVKSATRTLDGKQLSGEAYDAAVYREGRQFNYEFQYNDISPDFRAETGFIPRTDIRRIRQSVGYQFRPEGKFLISWRPGMFYDQIWDYRGTRLEVTGGVDLQLELAGGTFVNYFNFGNRERLRPQDSPGLTRSLDFSANGKGAGVNSSYFKRVAFEVNYSRWAGINFVPPAGQEPFHTDKDQGRLSVTIRPLTRLSVSNTYLLSRMRVRNSATERGASILNNHIIRSKWNWQFNRQLSLRAIFQYDALGANQKFTSLETRKNFNADFLLTYQVNPWTALYVGYNSNLQNLDLVMTPQGTRIARYPDRFINDGKQLFVKISYLFRF